MNYLAHLSLSGKTEDIIIGNFIGDFVKGKSYQDFPKSIQKGILLHRFIDDFTDNHSKVKHDISLIKDTIGRYSPIAIDVYYDYLLCQNWIKYHDSSLSQFCQDVYITIEKNKFYLPEKCVHMFSYMKRDNWLENYQYKEGIDRTLKNLSKRIQNTSNLEHAFASIEKVENEISESFKSFYDELQHESTQFIKLN